MGDEHLDTTPSIENLVPIPSEFEGISDDTSDVPNYDNNRVNIETDLMESLINRDTSIVYSSKVDPILEEFAELVSLEKVNDVDQEEKEFDLEDIFQIQDVNLRERLLKISRLISSIESLKNNPTPDFVLKSPSSNPISVTDSDSFFEESDTSLSHSDNSLPEFETFSDHTEETRSDSTTIHANYSLPEYDSFLFENDQGGLTSVVISDNSNEPLLELPEFESFHFDSSFPRPPLEPPDVEICLHFKPDAPVIDNFNKLNVKDDDSFTFVIRTFLLFLTYPEASPLSCSTGSEDTIFDPGIILLYIFITKPGFGDFNFPASLEKFLANQSSVIEFLFPVDIKIVCKAIVGTTYLPVGTYTLPAGTYTLPVGTTYLPVGTYTLPVGTTYLPVGTYTLPIVSLVGLACDPWDQRVRSQLIGKDLVSGLLVYESPLSSIRKKYRLSLKNDMPHRDKQFKGLPTRWQGQVKSSTLIGSLMPRELKEPQGLMKFTPSVLSKEAQSSNHTDATLAIRVSYHLIQRPSITLQSLLDCTSMIKMSMGSMERPRRFTKRL
ncbi:hypothetical protein Tco_0226560 [Tanacetum coccineum]